MQSEQNRRPARYLASLLVLLTLNGMAGAAQAAGDAKAGRKKAQMCSACHGIDGLAKIPTAPNLAGSPEMYLDKQLKAFRSEERKDENMNVVAKALSDADIADLAAWYAGINVEVTLPK